MFDFKQERMTTEQAANYIGLSKKTLAMYRTYSGSGKGPLFVKLGSRVFYKKCDVDAWIEANSGYINTTEARLSIKNCKKGSRYEQ